MIYIVNISTAKVLESSSNGGVSQKDFKIGGKNQQLWIKGVADDRGYFTLKNYHKPKTGEKLLTATETPNSSTILTIKGNITLRWIVN